MRASRWRWFLPLLLAGCGGNGGGPDPGEPPSGALHVATASLPPAPPHQPYEARVEAAGGTGVGQAWRVAEGSLPPGLLLDGGPACATWGTWSEAGTIEPGASGERSEVSGLAASRRNPGVLWAHDDSGREPLLHALGADGSVRQTYRLDVVATDWEDVALGPGEVAGVEVLYVADVGDNGTSRPYVTLLCVEEPLVPAAPGPTVVLVPDAFALRYTPGGSHDSEALLVDWESGTPYLLEKAEEGGDAWRVPFPLDPAFTPATPGGLVRVTTGRPLPALLTAADGGRDANRVVFRTYFAGYEQVRPPGLPFEAIFATDPCPFGVPVIGQYEALALGPDGASLWTTTERVLGDSAPLHRSEAESARLPAWIRGTPTAPGRYAIVLEVRDASGGARRTGLRPRRALTPPGRSRARGGGNPGGGEERGGGRSTNGRRRRSGPLAP